MTSKDRQEFFRDMDALFLSGGWTRLLHGWKEELNALPEQTFYNAKSYEDLEAARIRHQLLSELVNLQATIEMQRSEPEHE